MWCIVLAVTRSQRAKSLSVVHERVKWINLSAMWADMAVLQWRPETATQSRLSVTKHKNIPPAAAFNTPWHYDILSWINYAGTRPGRTTTWLF
jgi:hypothetical protein